MSGITWGTLTDRIARRAHKNLDNDDERADVEYYAKAGIEEVEAHEAWFWLRTAYTITLAPNDYDYNWPVGLARFDVRSFRYGAGVDSYLTYARRPENIDFELGPSWRTDSAKYGTPRWFVDYGETFWLGKVPDATFVAANPTLYFHGWCTDLYTISQIDSTATQTVQDATTLKIPINRVELYVCAALKEGLQQEDDPDWVKIENKFEKQLQRARSFNIDVNTDAHLQSPEFAKRMEF